MNNQLEDLMYQAGLTAQGCWDEMDDYAKEAIKRLAELIVRECMDICKKHPSRDLENGWFADAVAPHLIQQFEEHFGVTE